MSCSFLLDLRRRRLTNETTTEPSCKRIQQMSDQQHDLGINQSGGFRSVDPDDPLGVWRFVTVEGDGDEHPYMICTGNKEYYWNWNGDTGIDLIDATDMDLRNFDDNHLFYIKYFSTSCQFLQCNDRSYYVTYEPTEGSVAVKQFENQPECESNASLEIISCNL